MDEDKLQFTCLGCNVGFRDHVLRNEHFKTDWHLYNQKRKVAEMLPVTLESFNQRMAKKEAEMKVRNGEVKEPTGYCVHCRKSFNTQRAYEQHLQSKKHKIAEKDFELKKNKTVIANNRLNRKPAEAMEAEAEAAASSATAGANADGEDEDGMEVEEVDSDEWEDDDDDENPGNEPVAPNDCLFCPHHSSNIEKNLIHMTEKHSFFLPDLDYLLDLDAIVEYLGEKVGCGYMCLWCNQRGRHFKSVSAVQRHMVDKGHCKVNNEGDQWLEFSEFYDYSKSYPEGEGPDDADDADSEVTLSQLDDSGYQLQLPSGVKVGHRSLMRYYRQSLNPERAVQPHRSAVNKVLSHYKALGWTGLTGGEAKKKAKDLKFMHKLQHKHYMKLGVRANKLQRHFVDPSMFC